MKMPLKQMPLSKFGEVLNFYPFLSSHSFPALVLIKGVYRLPKLAIWFRQVDLCQTELFLITLIGRCFKSSWDFLITKMLLCHISSPRLQTPNLYSNFQKTRDVHTKERAPSLTTSSLLPVFVTKVGCHWQVQATSAFQCCSIFKSWPHFCYCKMGFFFLWVQFD